MTEQALQNPNQDLSFEPAVPTGWVRTELSELLDRIDYGHTASANNTASGPRFLRITDIQDDRVDWSSVPGCATTESESERYRLANGDIVFARTGATTGKSFLIRDCPEAIFASYLIRLRSKAGVLPEFLAYFFKSTDYWTQVGRKKKGTGQPGINSSVLSTLRVSVAPVRQQPAIVEALDSYLTRLHAATDGLRRVEANLKRYRASVIKAAVEGCLVPTEAELTKKKGRDYESGAILLSRILKENRRHWEESETAKMKSRAGIPKNSGWKTRYKEADTPDPSVLPRLPLGWCWSSADAVCTNIDSGSTPNGEMFTVEGVPFIKVYNLTFDGSLNFTKDPTFIGRNHHLTKMRRSTTIPGDVLMNIVGPPLGKVSLVPELFPECNINQAIVRFRAAAALLPGFLRLYLQSASCQAWLAKTTKTTTSQVNLSLTTCRALPLPIPPIAEQARIVEEVEDLLSTTTHGRGIASVNIERIARLRQAILKSAFEGKLVDQDPEDEPASVLLDRIRKESAAVATEAKRPSLSRARKTA